MERHPVVDLDGDPKAVPNTPMQKRRLRWVWLPVIGALAVLGVGLSIWLSGDDELRIEPPVIEGLTEEPSFAWQLSIPHDVTYTPVGDGVVLLPYLLGADDAVVSLVDLDSGEERWHQDYREYLPGSLLPYVSVRDLPGTERIAVMLSSYGEGPATRILLVDRSDGVVTATVETDGVAVMATSNAGVYYLMEHREGGVEISRLRSDDPNDLLWSAPLRETENIDEIVLLETQGHLLVTYLDPGDWFPLRGLIFRTDDGSRPEWTGDDLASYALVEDVMIVQNEGRDLAAIDLGTDMQLWQDDDCRCNLVSLDGVVYTSALRPSATDPSVRAQIRRIDPRTAEVQWETTTGGELIPRLATVGEHLVGLTIKIPDDADDPNPETPGVETCLVTFATQTGEPGGPHCHPTYGWLSWSGEDQLILWGHEWLMAVAPDETEPRWTLNFDDHSQIRDVNGVLLVHNFESGTIGVLE